MPPFFSIITATYNAASTLPRLLDSLVEQTCRDFNVIIQDGASQDNTVAIAESYRDRLPELILESSPDTGIYDAWNKAIPHISGEWVLFMGAEDDFVSPYALNHVMEILSVLPASCQYYAAPVQIIFSSGVLLETISPASLHELPQGMCLPHQGLFHRADLFSKEKFNKNFHIAGDYDFVCRTVEEKNFCKGDTPYVRMVFGGISSDMRHMLTREREFLYISRKYFPRALPWKIIARIFRCFLYSCVSCLFGKYAANMIADIPRRLSGRPALWTRALPTTNYSLSLLGKQPSVVLLIATIERTAELRRLLLSLRRQTYCHFQIIIADQNPTGILDEVLAPFVDLSITRISIPSRGVSAARNALLPLATGDIIAFPDDDCWYAPDTLAQVVSAFQRYPQMGSLLGIWAPDDVGLATNSLRDGVLSTQQCFRKGETYVQFFRREAVKAAGSFDPMLGPGNGLPYGCGEDTDFLLRARAGGMESRRVRAVRVYHPAAVTQKLNVQKIRSYARGRMYLLRKHQLPWWFTLANICYPAVCCLGALLKSDMKQVRYRWEMMWGRLSGYFS